MIKYTDLSKEDAKAQYEELKLEYAKYCDMGLKLDLSRGKPNSEQLDVSSELIRMPLEKDDCLLSGTDIRNYGILDGIPEAKKLFASLLGLKASNVIVGGNSSLQLMYDALSRAMIFGTPDSKRPWARERGLKWICVVPGYDRHF